MDHILPDKNLNYVSNLRWVNNRQNQQKLTNQSKFGYNIQYYPERKKPLL